MSLRITFQPEAKQEFFEAVDCYENERAGLGREFPDEIIQALRFASVHPQTFRKIRGDVRKVRLKHFRNYSVYFVLTTDGLAVVAVIHGARNPTELTRRLE